MMGILGDKKYNLYLDESGDSSFKSTRFLSLCGVLIEEKYNGYIENIFQEFKHVYNIENKILHLSDIRGNNKHYSFLKDDKIKTSFLLDLSDLLNKIDFKIISIVIDKEFLRLKYNNPVDPYHYSLTMLIEILVPFLIGVNGMCKISAESRNGANLDIPLEDHFKQIFDNGTRYGHYGEIKLENTKIQSAISSKNIKFFNKKSIIDNKVHGLEISDLLCNPMMRLIQSRIYQENTKLNRPTFSKPQIPIFTQENIIEKICTNRIIGINWQP